VGVSGEDGRLKLFTDQPDAAERLEIAGPGIRYETTTVEDLQLKAGETATDEIGLTRKTQISNT